MALTGGENTRQGYVTDEDGRLVVVSGESDGQVEGTVAAGAADSGNPVKVGAKYNATKPTLTDGWRGDLQLDSRGALLVNLINTGGTALTGDPNSIADGRATSGNYLWVGAGLMGYDANSATWNRVRTDSNFSLRASMYDKNANGLDFPNASDALSISNRYVPTTAFNYVYNGASMDRLRTATTFKPVSVSITAGTPQTVWTPASGKKFRLLGWALSGSAGGTVIFYDNTGSATMIARAPKAATNGLNNSPPNMGNGYISLAANNVLQIDSDATSTFTGFVFGMEE